MLKVISFLLMTMTILGCLIGVMQYQVTFQSREDARSIIDLMENILNHDCLVYKEDGNTWRGVFDKAKLDSNPSCEIPFRKNFYIEIKDSQNGNWLIGRKGFEIEDILSYPVLIKYPDKFVEGRMEVGIY
jgi:hypothetical protein